MNGKDNIVLPEPVASFREAIERVAGFDAGEIDALQPTGHTRLLLHGGPTERVAVLLHGITNNPLQWEAFGKELHANGWNVLIPRLPYHGRKDLLTSLPGQLTVVEMMRYTTEAVMVARGLGNRVAVVGLSAGGVYTAWAAQEMDIERAVVIAPLFGITHVPLWVAPILIRFFRMFPNQMLWWDRKLKAKHIPPHAYPKFSTRNLAETLYMGEWVMRRARTTPPRCRSLSILDNAGDRSVSNTATDTVAASWRKQGATVTQFRYPASDGLPHDLIDLTQPRGRTATVYAKIREMLEA